MGGLFIQNDFTHGELAPRLVARNDITLYNKGAELLRNVVVIPEGGAKRRFGTLYIDDLTALGSTFRIVPFEYSETVKYLFVFYSDNIAVFENDSLVTTITTTGITGSQISEFDYAQTTNNLVIVHPDFNPKQIVRTAATPTFSISAIPFDIYPAFDFTNRIYQGYTFTLGAKTIGSTTLTSSTAIFTDEFIGGLFIGPGPTVTDPIGFGRITAKTSSTIVTLKIISEFQAVSVPGEDAILAAKAWSDTEADASGNRGWPVSVTFYQDRIWFGGSRSLPQTLFGSRIGQYANFDVQTGLDDDAIQVDLSTSQLNDIKYVISDKSLQIFTYSSEWSVIQEFAQPITPATIAVLPMTKEGISSVKPQVLDNVTFYAKRGGKGIEAYVYSSDNYSYSSENVSLLSSQLIVNPQEMAVLKNLDSDDFHYLFVVNSDGTLACYQTLREQNISAWTLANTQTQDSNGDTVVSNFKNITHLDNEVYFIVERVVGGATKYFLEKLSFDVYTDATIVQNLGAPTSTITGLTALNNSTVCVRGGLDGSDYSYGEYLVTSNEIELVQDAPTVTNELQYADVGFCFNPTIQTMPFVPSIQNGTSTFVPKRVNRVFIYYYLSLGIYVDDVLIPNLNLGDSFSSLSLTPSGTPQTGKYQLYHQGWELTPQLTITQNEPLPMTILAIGYEVTV